MIKVGRKKKFQLRRPKGKKKNPAATADCSPSAPPWIELPRDVTANILNRLGPIEILESAQKVCTTWRRVCQDPAMWRVINMKNLDGMPYSVNFMCRHAVDRSQGQLIDINIKYFGTDELLAYISNRSSDLRHLTLACCCDISGEGLREAVKSFPQLEELHLFLMTSIRAEDIENVAISCPMLKSFTFNNRGYRLAEVDNGYALAVASNMPNLCHLQLFGNRLNNEGLQAILDNCPYLESLDLRQCFSVDLRQEIGKRCSQQIKNLRRTSDSTDDYEWDAEIYDSEDDNYSTDDFECDAEIYDHEDDTCSSYYSDYNDRDHRYEYYNEYSPDNEVWFFDHNSF